MIKLNYEKWWYYYYLFYINILEFMLCRDRTSICILIFYDYASIGISIDRILMNAERRVVSNHFVQSYALLCYESERIIKRLQTFKEPDRIYLFMMSCSQ